MNAKTITVGLMPGLEARPAAVLVQVASGYTSNIYLEVGSKKVNAKSIMGMMTLGLNAGDQVTVKTEGPDENAAMSDVEKFLTTSK